MRISDGLLKLDSVDSRHKLPDFGVLGKAEAFDALAERISRGGGRPKEGDQTHTLSVPKNCEYTTASRVKPNRKFGERTLQNSQFESVHKS